MVYKRIKRCWIVLALLLFCVPGLPAATSAQSTLGTYSAGPPGVRWGQDRINQRYGPLDTNASLGSHTGSSVHVFVLDTGINYNHNEFVRAPGGPFDRNIDLNGSRNFVPDRPVNQPITQANVGDIFDCDGHGTATASIIGGRYRGIAPNVTLHIVRVAGCAGSVNSTAVQIAGINYVANTVAAWRGSGWNQPVMAVLNIGGVRQAENPNDYAQYVAAVNNLANGVGVPTFVTAHNYNTGACAPYGANAALATVPHVITVGAVNRLDQRPRLLNSDVSPPYTQANWTLNGSGTGWGSCVDLLAPNDGEYVATISGGLCYTAPDGVDRSNRCSSYFFGGSSAAMPHAAGIAALWLEQNHGYGQSASGAAALEVDMIRAATKGVLYNASNSASAGSAATPASLGPGTPNRLLFAFPVAPSANAWGPLRRYYNATTHKHWVSTLPPPPGFVQEAAWGIEEGSVVHVVNAPGGVRLPWLPDGATLPNSGGFVETYTSLTRPLYSCIVYNPLDPAGSVRTIPSLDPGCEGLPNNHPNPSYRHIQIGHIFAFPANGATLALYRCITFDGQDHYLSPAANCEGAGTSEGRTPSGAPAPIGYVFGN